MTTTIALEKETNPFFRADDASIRAELGMTGAPAADVFAELRERKARVVQGRMARSGEDAVGSDCGGTMRVFIDVHGLRPRLILLGAGHVNRAVAKAAAPLGFAIFVAVAVICEPQFVVCLYFRWLIGTSYGFDWPS